MRIVKLEENIFEVTASRVVDADCIHGDLLFMEQAGMLTFGDQTTRILYDEFVKRGYSVELSDLCYDDDLSIGLQMPETWYLNRGLYAASISMYFNFLNYKEQAKSGCLYSTNSEVVREYGRIAAIEVYIESDLRKQLDKSNKRYFGTPRTLTECMRLLEGWDIDRIPRFRRYITYADFIQLWCSINFSDYKESEWRLGKEASKKIFAINKTTNVREGIRYFWENYLERRKNKIAPEDTEVDIIDPDFQSIREPRYVLLGEDIYADESIYTGSEMVFKSFSESKSIKYPRNMVSNEKQFKTAKLVRARFPSTTVILFKNPLDMPTFTMTKFDEIKEGVSRELAVVANGLYNIHFYVKSGEKEW
jgi:hypothetical protein